MSAVARTATVARTITGHVVGGCNVCDAGIAYPSDRSVTVLCPGCGTPVELRMVSGILSDDACNSRCMWAIGDDCECGCVGANHGIGHMARLLPTWIPIPGAPIPVEYVDQSTAARTGRASTARKAADRRQRANDQRAARNRDKAAKKAAARAAMMTNPAVAAIMGDRYADRFGFLDKMRALIDTGTELTPGQLTAVERIIAQDAERDATRAAQDAARTALVASGRTVTAGRQTITGTITNLDTREYGPRWATRTRVVVTVAGDDGLRYWGTLPDALTPPWSRDIADAYVGWHGRAAGQRVTLVATVEPFEDDATAGRFTRPVVPAGTPALSHVGPAAQDPSPAVTPAPVVTARPAGQRRTPAARQCRYHGPETICPDCGPAEAATLTAIHAEREAIQKANAAYWEARDNQPTATDDPAPFVSGWATLSL